MEKPNKTFIIMTSGRAASSLVAKCLHEGGVHMGDKFLIANEGNPKGYFEDVDFFMLNRKIIDNDAWDRPLTASIHDVYDLEAENLIKQKNNKALWGWKDPRNSLTIDKYYKHLEDPIIVALFRKPKLAAQSFYERDGTPLDVAEKMVRDYNKKILEFLSKEFL